MKQETKDLFLDFLGEIEHVSGDMYHFDTWNDLMKVVKRCTAFATSLGVSNPLLDKLNEVFIKKSGVVNFLMAEIDEIIKSCVEFITFYNEQQKSVSH
jgi:hypothetical protein